jgi:perosamine synthetase
LRTRSLRIPLAKPDIGKEEIEAVAETMRSGWVTQGRKVEEFENAFAKYCGVKHGVAANSGTAALHLALASLNIKRGDEVITTPLSCVATTNPVLYLDAEPVFVDVDPETLNIDPALVEKKITRKTSAILPVHLFGHPVDLDPLMEIAEKHGIPVIEDAAQAHGARYKGKKVGAFGRISCFSFYADKGITTVEGGMSLTDNSELAEKMRLLRSFGMDKHSKFLHSILGYNYKMSDIHAAIGLAQLRKLDTYIEHRRRNILHLKKQVNNPNLKLPIEKRYAFNVYYVCHILAEKAKDKIVKHLERRGIETRPLLSFIPEQKPYHRYGNYIKECKIAREANQKGFYVTNSPLLAKDELDYLSSTLNTSPSEI